MELAKVRAVATVTYYPSPNQVHLDWGKVSKSSRLLHIKGPGEFSREVCPISCLLSRSRYRICADDFMKNQIFGEKKITKAN